MTSGELTHRELTVMLTHHELTVIGAPMTDSSEWENRRSQYAAMCIYCKFAPGLVKF